MLSIRIGQRRILRSVGAPGVYGPYGVGENGQGRRPSVIHTQVRDVTASAHSVTIEGAMDVNGPWKILATITDTNATKINEVPDYIRVGVNSATGGNVDVLMSGGVS